VTSATLRTDCPPAVAHLAQHWPRIAVPRHKAHQALAGGLLRDAVPQEEAEVIVQALAEAVRDEEAAKRVAGLAETAQRLRENKPVAGWPKLAEALGADGKAVVARFRCLLGTAATVDMLAEHKGLPAEFLRELGLGDEELGGIAVPYRDAGGKTVETKTRRGLSAHTSKWPKGKPLLAYGEDRLDRAAEAGVLNLFEGESDCWALWFHDLPALGLPGSETVAKVFQAGHVGHLRRLYVYREPDTGGEAFVANVAKRLAELGWRGEARVVTLGDIKDPSDLHKVDPDGFREAWGRAVEAATPLPLPAPASASWPDPIPLGGDARLPPFPVEALPPPLADWARCEAEATQTPPELAGLLALGVCGAALAGRFRVRVRDGWAEPTNLFVAVALPPGERKSAVFAEALAPVIDFERGEAERMAPLIAEAASEHRQLEARLKSLEAKIGKASGGGDVQALREEAKEAARALATHKVPQPPQLHCDDVTPEALARLLAAQGGRMLQASAEGALFEIVKGRYSEGGKANLEVYLKGHAGDALRVHRVGRDPDLVPCPALSAALAVQPDVIRGLAEQDVLSRRGFLARWLYALPASRVGRRKVGARAVPAAVRGDYRDLVLSLWRLPAEPGEPEALALDAGADQALQAFERWLEPRLAEGEELSFLAGWAAKLAGACARIAGIFHVVGAGSGWRRPVEARTVEAAIRLGRDYLLPHALAAFHLMGADAKLGPARAVWESIRGKVAHIAYVARGEAPAVSRRDVFTWNRRRFGSVDKLDPVLAALENHYYLRNEGEGKPGRGNKGPTWLVNPKALAEEQLPPRAQRTQRAQPGASGAEEGTSETGAPRAQARATCATGGTGDGGPPPGREVAHVAHVARAEGLGPARPVPATTNGEVAHVAHVAPGGAPAAAPSPNGAPGAAAAPVSGQAADGTPYVLVRDAEGLRVVLAAVEGSVRVGLDVETTGLDPRKDRARLLQVAPDRGEAVYLVDCFHADPRPLFEALAGKALVGHHLAFDLGFLAALGFEPGECHDTLLLSQLLHGMRQKKGFHGLAAALKRELGSDLPKELQRSDWSGALSQEQLDYAARDAAVLLPLFRSLSDKVRAAGMEQVAEIERRALPAVAWLARSGAMVDRAAWLGLAHSAEAEVGELGRQLDAAAPPRHGALFREGAWNWDSPEQVKGAFGAVGIELESSDDGALAQVEHPLADLIRRYRSAAKRSQTYGLKWLGHLAQGGRVYAGWKQIGSDAGRMSCASPNLQQLPRGDAYRRCFRPPEGRVLVKADYSQIELRIAAKVSGDKALLEAYRRGEDLHTRTARSVLGVAEVTKQHRQLAKALNFGLLYGMGAKGFRAYAKSTYGLDLTEDDARRYRDAFFQSYPGLAAWHRRVGRTKDQTVETRTLAGRRRLGVLRFTEKLNSPVQGTGADGLKAALALLWERRGEVPGAFPVLAVHDEVVIECDHGQAPAVEAWLRKAMVDAMAPLIEPVPVEVEVKVARTWGG
jgi:DNA polymerase-1